MSNVEFIPRKENFGISETLISEWSIATEEGRMAQRRSCSPDSLRKFYEIAVQGFGSLVDQIGDRQVDSLDERERVILNFLLSVVEVSQMVEVFGAGGMGPEAFDERRFVSLM